MNRNPLSVLIVEDNPRKKQKLIQHVQSKSDLFEPPVVSICTSEAIKHLSEKCYDLLILDVSIPLREAGDPAEENSIDLLRRLDGMVGGIKKPLYTLPISSVVSLSRQTREFFKYRPWGIIPYDEGSSESLAHIDSIATWIFNDRTPDANDKHCDIFVLTALEEPEFAAIEAALPNLGPLQPLDTKQLIRFSEMESNGRNLVVGTGFCQRMGPVAAAILTSKVISHLRPKLIVMAGICAGVSEKVGFGDLIAAEETWDWQSGKFVDSDGDEGFQGAPHQLGFDSILKNSLVLLKNDNEFWRNFRDMAEVLGLPPPKMMLGPLATGASVVADDRVIKRIKTLQNKNVIGLDMETYAVHAAVEASPEVVKAVSLKSVCDKGNREKNDAHQKFAAKVSAESTVRFIEKYCGDIFD